MNEVECNAVTLENGIKYFEASRILFDKCMYVLLSNPNDSSDFCIRKLISKNNKEYIIGLDNDAEYDNVMLAFVNRGSI